MDDLLALGYVDLRGRPGDLDGISRAQARGLLLDEGLLDRDVVRLQGLTDPFAAGSTVTVIVPIDDSAHVDSVGVRAT